MRLGAAKIATGHYARVAEKNRRYELLRGTDSAKDQSYFLHRLTQEQLARVLFPVGELEKREVRRIALEAGLPNHAKKDSTGICFIGERPFREFLNRYLPKAPGAIVDENGNTIGERSEEHTSELQSRLHLVCRLLLEKKKRRYQEPQCL